MLLYPGGFMSPPLSDRDSDPHRVAARRGLVNPLLLAPPQPSGNSLTNRRLLPRTNPPARFFSNNSFHTAQNRFPPTLPQHTNPTPRSGGSGCARAISLQPPAHPNSLARERHHTRRTR